MERRTIGARGWILVAVVLLAGAFIVVSTTAAAPDETEAAGPPASAEPDALVKALVEAAADNDDDVLKALAGPKNADLIQPGGDPSVAKVRAEFAARAKAFRKLEDNEDGSKTLVIGINHWPFPILLRKTDAGWILDVPVGREEILARRIGKNELDAIRLCKTYIRLQVEYASKDHDGDGVREYARRLRSTPGTKDGLYWETGEDGEVSPLGPLIESAREYFEKREPGDPVGGYVWRILEGQGGTAPGGCCSYVINGNMIAGFALVGFPAQYGTTGVMTFMISNHGQVVSKDLGPDTADFVAAMSGFCPDASWTVEKED
ncbi:MAG: DUF2950 family protein [Planctomycetota bacterium]